MAVTVRNATFSLPVSILERLREHASAKDIPSLNAGVREALEEYLKKIEKTKLHQQMREASQDPLFMKDLNDSIQAFEHSDAEIGRDHEW